VQLSETSGKLNPDLVHWLLNYKTLYTIVARDDETVIKTVTL